MPFPKKVTEVMDRSRVYLNDVGESSFTDTVLLPYFKAAYDDLRLELEDNNVPFSNETSAVIPVVAGITNIGGDGGPALPLNLIDIIEIYERTTGTTNDFIRMSPTRFLPKTSVLTSHLQYYAWQGQVLNFIGSNSNIDVKIDYVADNLEEIVNVDTGINLFNARIFLSYRTAALAAEFSGENKTRADSLNANGQRSLDSMLNITIKSQQNMPVRRRPFRSRFKLHTGSAR